VAFLLPLRGSIQFQRWKFRAAAKDYKMALNDAEGKSAAPKECGFLLTELGFAEVFCLKPREGKQKIEDGLKLMFQGPSSPGFLVRVLRKHAISSMVNFDFQGARASAKAALKIAEDAQLYDQLQPLKRIITMVRSA